MNMKRAHANYIAENIRLSKRNKEHEITDYAGLVKFLQGRSAQCSAAANAIETLVAKIAELEENNDRLGHELAKEVNGLSHMGEPYIYAVAGRASFRAAYRKVKEERDSLRQQLEAAQKDVKRTCEWTEQDPDYASDTWSSECGEMWSFTDGGIEDNRVNFCHGCGGKIVEIKWEETS